MTSVARDVLDHETTFLIFLDIDGVLNRNTIPVLNLDNDETYDCNARDRGRRDGGDDGDDGDTTSISYYLPHWRQTQEELFDDCVRRFDPEAVANLHMLITKLEERGFIVSIVISSSWRIDRSVDDLRRLFSPHAFSHHIISKTENYTTRKLSNGESVFLHPRGGPTWSRAYEIKCWLVDHLQGRRDYESLSFVILDDVDDYFSAFFSTSKYHITNSTKLLTADDVTRVLERS